MIIDLRPPAAFTPAQARRQAAWLERLEYERTHPVMQIEFDLPASHPVTPGGEIAISDPVQDHRPWWAFWRKVPIRHYLVLEPREGLAPGTVHVRAVEVVPG